MLRNKVLTIWQSKTKSNTPYARTKTKFNQTKNTTVTPRRIKLNREQFDRAPRMAHTHTHTHTDCSVKYVRTYVVLWVGILAAALDKHASSSHHNKCSQNTSELDKVSFVVAKANSSGCYKGRAC